MAIIEIKNLSFKYSGSDDFALKNVNLSIEEGSFTYICGGTGSGKTTLLKHLKPELSPKGERLGEVLFSGSPIGSLNILKSAENLGYVFQNPDNQIVMEKCSDEIQFGLNNLSLSEDEKKLRMAEICSLFNINHLLNTQITMLSGGQKQILNLASVMAMRPKVIILDEPVSRLDPVSASEFFSILKRVNDNFGTAIILTEQRGEEIFPLCDRVIIMDSGCIISDSEPHSVFNGATLFENEIIQQIGVPTSVRLFKGLKTSGDFPLTAKHAITRLKTMIKTKGPAITITDKNIEKKADKTGYGKTAAVDMKDVFFRYSKHSPDVLCGFDLTADEGEFLCILGGNGAGKTTALSVIGGLRQPYSGRVKIYDKKINEYKNGSLYDNMISAVPQNPYLIFTAESVLGDLKYMTRDQNEINALTEKLNIEKILNRHPYDLSGGEAQKAALAKALLTNPKILILDEPTKGLDYNYKEFLGSYLKELKLKGLTIVCATHDVEFAAKFSDNCCMFFDGKLSAKAPPREFFNGNLYYTTSANIIARAVNLKSVNIDELANDLKGHI